MVTYIAVGKNKTRTVVCVVVNANFASAIRALCERHRDFHSEQWELTQVPTVEWIKTVAELPAL